MVSSADWNQRNGNHWDPTLKGESLKVASWTHGSEEVRRRKERQERKVQGSAAASSESIKGWINRQAWQVSFFSLVDCLKHLYWMCLLSWYRIGSCVCTVLKLYYLDHYVIGEYWNWLEIIGEDWSCCSRRYWSCVVVVVDIGAAFVSQHWHLLGALVGRWCEPAQIFAWSSCRFVVWASTDICLELL